MMLKLFHSQIKLTLKNLYVFPSSIFSMLHVCIVAQLCLTLCDPLSCSPKAPESMGFSRQEYWSGVPCPPPPGDLPNPEIEPVYPVSCLACRFFTS